MSKRVAELLVETVEAASVKTCYGIVGDTLNRIAHATDHNMQHEAGALTASVNVD